MLLSDRDIAELTLWRHELHRRPELSGQEAETARAVESTLAAARADRIVSGLGGHGVAAVYEGAASGPTVMFRAELDGLAHRGDLRGPASLHCAGQGASLRP